MWHPDMPENYKNQIVTGDARDLAQRIPDASIDLIFTDPPYTKEFMHLYSWLAETAARVLRPDGFLFAYAGVYWKWDVMRRLSEHLDYWFDMVLSNSGKSSIMWNKRVISRYKSILVFTRKGETPRARVIAVSWFNGGGEDKRYHTWGQDESSARYYIDCFSQKGDIVYDPFAGGGTTVAVCKALERNFVASEIRPDMAEIARARVAVIEPPLFTLPQQAEMFTQEPG